MEEEAISTLSVCASNLLLWHCSYECFPVLFQIWFEESPTLYLIVCSSPHVHAAVSEKPHLCRRWLLFPWSVRILFSVYQIGLVCSKPSGLKFGSSIKELFLTFDSFHCFIHSSCWLTWSLALFHIVVPWFEPFIKVAKPSL